MLRRLRSDERGVALGVAMGVLSVMAVISAVTFAAAFELSETSNTDRNGKRAFQAAETGLQVATYRLNNLAPLDGQCITNTGVIIIGEGCEGSGQISDGASWTYHMTPVLSNGTCAGYLIEFDINDPDLSLAPRCVTATGTVNGVTRRVQARIVLFKGLPLFQNGGIIGLTGVEVKNAANVTGEVGSNGLVKVGNSSGVTGGIELGPGAPTPQVGNSNISVNYRTPQTGPWVLSPVEIGNTATVNNNGAWTISSNPTWSWNATTRVMSLTKGTLTLLGGTYNFCNLTIGNNASIVVASGATARIFIDHPERGATGGCAAGTGRMIVNNNFSNPGDPEDLQIYVYGPDLNSSTPAVEFNNHATVNFALHAPRASIVFKNHATITGAINANFVDFKNSLDFTSGATVGSLRTLTSAILHQRTAWRECRRQPTDPGDPTSGC